MNHFLVQLSIARNSVSNNKEITSAEDADPQLLNPGLGLELEELRDVRSITLICTLSSSGPSIDMEEDGPSLLLFFFGGTWWNNPLLSEVASSLLPWQRGRGSCWGREGPGLKLRIGNRLAFVIIDSQLGVSSCAKSSSIVLLKLLVIWWEARAETVSELNYKLLFSNAFPFVLYGEGNRNYIVIQLFLLHSSIILVFRRLYVEASSMKFVYFINRFLHETGR